METNQQKTYRMSAKRKSSYSPTTKKKGKTSPYFDTTPTDLKADSSQHYIGNQTKENKTSPYFDTTPSYSPTTKKKGKTSPYFDTTPSYSPNSPSMFPESDIRVSDCEEEKFDNITHTFSDYIPFKIGIFNGENVEQFSSEVQRAIFDIAMKYGLEANAGKVNWNPLEASFNVKMNVSKVEGKNYAQHIWDVNCTSKRLSPEDYGSYVIKDGQSYKIIGLNPKNNCKNCIFLKKSSDNNDPSKVFTMDVESFLSYKDSLHTQN